MLKLSSREANFSERLAALLDFETAQDPAVDTAVADIIQAVKTQGDAALLAYTARFDRLLS